MIDVQRTMQMDRGWDSIKEEMIFWPVLRGCIGLEQVKEKIKRQTANLGSARKWPL